MCHSFNPIQCIIPPYISDKLGKKTTTRGPEPPNTDLETADRIRRQRQQKSRALTPRIAHPEKMIIEIHDADQLPILPGDKVWSSGEAETGIEDQSVKDVINGGADTWKFYKTLFDRNSLDNKGMTQVHSVHYRDYPTKPFGNALWNGSQMIYGDGDGITFSSFTSDIDIIAHELSHGVISFEADFEYKDESGALNESFADVFGILVKQWAKGTAARKSNWLIGENILIGDHYALRSMKAPGTAYKNHPELDNDPQPAVMANYIHTTEDDGGVHFNSGIPNHAFYIAAWEMNGNAWEKAGRIWYAVLTDKSVSKKSSFADVAQASIRKARELFSAKEEKAVTKGWKDTGVL